MTILAFIIYISFFMSGALMYEGLNDNRGLPLAIGISLIFCGFIAMHRAGLVK